MTTSMRTDMRRSTIAQSVESYRGSIATALVAVLAVAVPVDHALAQEPPIQREIRIGAEIGEPEYEFGHITTMAFVGTDRIAVADGMSKTIRVFTLDGLHLVTLGRAGRGPGEFVHPSTIIADSLIRVFDPMQHRTVTFDPVSRRHVSTTALRTVAGANVTTVVPLRPGQFVAATTPAWSWNQPGHQTDVAVLHVTDGGRADTLATFHQGLTIWYTPGSHAPWGLAASRFGTAGAWAVRDSTLALVDGYAGMVRFLTARADGSLQQTAEVRLPGNSRPVVSGDLSEVEDSARAEHQRAGWKIGRIGFEPPPRWSIGQVALFADDTHLWVLQEITGDRRERWTEVTTSGVTHSWLFPPDVRIRAVALPYVGAVTVLESGVQQVVIYRLGRARSRRGGAIR